MQRNSLKNLTFVFIMVAGALNLLFIFDPQNLTTFIQSGAQWFWTMVPFFYLGFLHFEYGHFKRVKICLFTVTLLLLIISEFFYYGLGAVQKESNKSFILFIVPVAELAAIFFLSVFCSLEKNRLQGKSRRSNG